MKHTGRLQIYPPTGPQGTGYIVADRSALRGLAEAAKSAATGAMGFETVKLYSSDGHEYELIITGEVDDQEWQSLPTNYVDHKMPSVSMLQNYQNLREEIVKKRQQIQKHLTSNH